MRETYRALIADPEKIEGILQAGADKATALAAPFMQELRHAVGLRPLMTRAAPKAVPKAVKASAPSFKQYRGTDGLFYFKFLNADDQLLLESRGFASPQEAAKAVAALKNQDPNQMQVMRDQGTLLPGIEYSDVVNALMRLAAG